MKVVNENHRWFLGFFGVCGRTLLLMILLFICLLCVIKFYISLIISIIYFVIIFISYSVNHFWKIINENHQWNSLMIFGDILMFTGKRYCRYFIGAYCSIHNSILRLLIHAVKYFIIDYLSYCIKSEMTTKNRQIVDELFEWKSAMKNLWWLFGVSWGLRVNDIADIFIAYLYIWVIKFYISRVF